MALFSFRILHELNVNGKFDPRAVVPLDAGVFLIGKFDGTLELYGQGESNEERYEYLIVHYVWYFILKYYRG